MVERLKYGGCYAIEWCLPHHRETKWDHGPKYHCLNMLDPYYFIFYAFLLMQLLHELGVSMFTIDLVQEYISLSQEGPTTTWQQYLCCYKHELCLQPRAWQVGQIETSAHMRSVCLCYWANFMWERHGQHQWRIKLSTPYGHTSNEMSGSCQKRNETASYCDRNCMQQIYGWLSVTVWGSR